MANATTDDSTLTYFFPTLSEKISTDILEIETYSNNLVVAPTIGNLVVSYSDERPRPYLAKCWHQEGLKWIFELREDIRCGNGEEITAATFATSLARSIRLYSQDFAHPIFKHLKGFRELIRHRTPTFEGITASNNTLIFDFKTPVHSGFLEHLAMSPFGYICSANYEGDIWKDPHSIISSGPYSLEPLSQQSSYTLHQRQDFPSDLKTESKIIRIERAGFEEFKSHNGPKILDHASPTMAQLVGFTNIPQIRQNLVVVKLNPNRGPFSETSVRQSFLKEFRSKLDSMPLESQTVSKTARLFPEDNSTLNATPEADTKSLKNLKVLMKVMVRSPLTPNDFNKTIIEEIARENGWELTIDSGPYDSFRETYQDPKYDICVQGSEVGSRFEPWVIDMLFCSDIGDRWPDPSGRIRKLTESFDPATMSASDASQKLHDYLTEDASLIPTFLRGGYYLFGSGVDASIFGKTVSRIHPEEIRLKR